jgi:hypothetical protein
MTYTCTECRKTHDTFDRACECCKADFIECPLSEIPDDAELFIDNGKYVYGSNFIVDGWFIGLAQTPTDEPSRIYNLPPLVSKIIDKIYRDQYEKGNDDARQSIRKALGL